MATKEVHAVESIEDARRMIEGQLCGDMELRINASWHAQPAESRHSSHYYAGIRLGDRLIVDVHGGSPRELAQLALSALVNWRLVHGREIPQPRPRPAHEPRQRSHARRNSSPHLRSY